MPACRAVFYEEEPTTEVAIRRGFWEDLYIVMPAFEVEEQTASVEVHINPLVNWVWLGFGIMALGTGIALLPEGAIGFAIAKLPAEAATASLLLLSLLLTPTPARAQHVEEPQNAQMQVFSKETREVAKKLACWCGGCSKLPVGECTCGHCAIEKTKIAGMLKEGQTEQNILDYYVASFGGQHILSEPLNQGIGRMAWLVPYLAGLGGLLAAFMVAMRWSRKPVLAGTTGTGYEEDAQMASRLDDELRDLD